MRRLLVAVGVALLLVGGCDAFAPSNLRNAPHPYPAGCPDFDMSPKRCKAVIDWAVKESGVEGQALTSAELIDPPCSDDPKVLCKRSGSATLIRLRFADGGSAEETVYCGVGGQYSILCTETPEIRISGPTLDGSGYRDVPCANENGVGCGLPLPSPDPAAVAEARPLRIRARDIPIDHVGHYDVELGHAVLRNGVVATSAIELANKLSQDVVMSENGIVVDVTSTMPGAPPFHNYYDRGWHPGPEEVVLTLRFDVVGFTPGAVLQIRDVDLE